MCVVPLLGGALLKAEGEGESSIGGRGGEGKGRIEIG